MTANKIDRALGIIFGVSVITEGVAKGHGLRIDSKTLETVKEVASEFSSGVKVKLRHKQDGEHQDVILETAGTLKHFRIEGDKLRADFHLLKSLNKEISEKIFEMAETMPEHFGLSIAFSGVTEVKGEHKFARCEELQSIDLSDNPAANPGGLFSASCELCGKSCKGHSMDEVQGMYDAEDDEEKKKKFCSYAEQKHGRKLSEKSKHKSMSAPTNEELALSISTLTKTVEGLVTKLGTPQPVTTLSYTDKDGKVIQLSAEQISTALSTTSKLASDAQKATDIALRGSIIRQMDAEGRVPMNPATKKAYTLAELNTVPLETLQFAAVNSPVIPLEAKAIYRGTEGPKIDPALKGSDKVQAAWSEKYDSLDNMRARFNV